MQTTTPTTITIKQKGKEVQVITPAYFENGLFITMIKDERNAISINKPSGSVYFASADSVFSDAEDPTSKERFDQELLKATRKLTSFGHKNSTYIPDLIQENKLLLAEVEDAKRQRDNNRYIAITLGCALALAIITGICIRYSITVL